MKKLLNKKYFEKLVLILADWPSQSSDSNIIEHEWKLLKKVMEKCPINVNELWQMVEKIFYAIPDDDIEKLLNSLPKRLTWCLKNRGWSINYRKAMFLYARALLMSFCHEKRLYFSYFVVKN